MAAVYARLPTNQSGEQTNNNQPAIIGQPEAFGQQTSSRVGARRCVCVCRVVQSMQIHYPSENINKQSTDRQTAAAARAEDRERREVGGKMMMRVLIELTSHRSRSRAGSGTRTASCFRMLSNVLRSPCNAMMQRSCKNLLPGCTVVFQLLQYRF